MSTLIKSIVAVALCGLGGAYAAEMPNGDSAKLQYDAERARCISGATGQDQASCLRSAGAAYDALRQGRLRDANADYRDNALARCRTLQAAERVDCESRVDGGGSSSGSVKGGGIVKETVTTIPGTPPTVLPASPVPK